MVFKIIDLVMEQTRYNHKQTITTASHTIIITVTHTEAIITVTHTQRQ